MQRGPEGYNNSIYYSHESQDTSFYSLNDNSEQFSFGENCPEQQQNEVESFIISQEQKDVCYISTMENHTDTQRSLFADVEVANHQEVIPASNLENGMVKTLQQLQDQQLSVEGSEHFTLGVNSFRNSPTHRMCLQELWSNRSNPVFSEGQIETPKLIDPIYVQTKIEPAQLNRVECSYGNQVSALAASQQKFKFPDISSTGDSAFKVSTQDFRKGIMDDLAELRQTYKRIFDAVDEGGTDEKTQDVVYTNFVDKSKLEESFTRSDQEINLQTQQSQFEIVEEKKTDIVSKVYHDYENSYQANEQLDDIETEKSEHAQNFERSLNYAKGEIKNRLSILLNKEYETPIYQSFEIFSQRNSALTETLQDNNTQPTTDQHFRKDMVIQSKHAQIFEQIEIKFQNKTTNQGDNDKKLSFSYDTGNIFDSNTITEKSEIYNNGGLNKMQKLEVDNSILDKSVHEIHPKKLQNSAKCSNLQEENPQINAQETFESIGMKNKEKREQVKVLNIMSAEENELLEPNGADEFAQKIHETLIINKFSSFPQISAGERQRHYGEIENKVESVDGQRIISEYETLEGFYAKPDSDLNQDLDTNKGNLNVTNFGVVGRNTKDSLNLSGDNEFDRIREEEIVLKYTYQSCNPQQNKIISPETNRAQPKENYQNVSEFEGQPASDQNYQAIENLSVRREVQNIVHGNSTNLRESTCRGKDFTKDELGAEPKLISNDTACPKKFIAVQQQASKGEEPISTTPAALIGYDNNTAIQKNIASKSSFEHIERQATESNVLIFDNSTLQTKLSSTLKDILASRHLSSQSFSTFMSENHSNEPKCKYENHSFPNTLELLCVEQTVVLGQNDKATKSPALIEDKYITTQSRPINQSLKAAGENTSERSVELASIPLPEPFYSRTKRDELEKMISLSEHNFSQPSREVPMQEVHTLPQPYLNKSGVFSYNSQLIHIQNEKLFGTQFSNTQVFYDNKNVQLKSQETPKKDPNQPYEQCNLEEGRKGYFQIENYQKSPKITKENFSSDNSENPSKLKTIYSSVDSPPLASSFDEPQPFIFRQVPRPDASPVYEDESNALILRAIEPNEAKLQLNRLVRNSTTQDNLTTKASKSDSKGRCSSWRYENSGQASSSFSKSHQKDISPEEEIRESFHRTYDRKKKIQMNQAQSFEERMKTDIQFRNNQLRALNLLLEEAKPRTSANVDASLYIRFAKSSKRVKSQVMQGKAHTLEERQSQTKSKNRSKHTNTQEDCFERLSRDSRRRNALVREREKLKNQIENIFAEKLYTNPSKKIQNNVMKIISRLWEDANNRKIVKDKIAALNVAEDIIKAYDFATVRVKSGETCPTSNTCSKEQTTIDTSGFASRLMPANLSGAKSPPLSMRLLSMITGPTIGSDIRNPVYSHSYAAALSTISQPEEAYPQTGNERIPLGDLEYLQQAREALLLQHLKVRGNIEMYRRSRGHSQEGVTSLLSPELKHYSFPLSQISSIPQTNRSPIPDSNLVSARSPRSKQCFSQNNSRPQTPIQQNMNAHKRKDPATTTNARNNPFTRP